MRSHNTQLRTAYFTALSGIEYNGEPVMVYSDMAEDNAPSPYIVFSSIINNDNSPKTGVDIESSIVVSIYSNSAKYNNSNAVDAVANEVLQRIMSGIEISGVQNVQTQMVNDNTTPWRFKGQLIAVDRLITFRHKIFQGT